MSDTPQPQLFTAIHRYLRESKVEGVTLTIEPGAQEDTASVVLAAQEPSARFLQPWHGSPRRGSTPAGRRCRSTS